MNKNIIYKKHMEDKMQDKGLDFKHKEVVNISNGINPHYTRFFPLLQASFSRFRADIHRKSGVLFPRLHKLQEISAEPLTEARKESRINAGVL